PWSAIFPYTTLFRSIGLLGMFMAGGCYYLAKWNSLALVGAVVSLGINWFGDSMDGTLARVRDRQRPRYGFYVDHIVDRNDGSNQDRKSTRLNSSHQI